MASPERLIFSICEEPRSVHVLTWDDKDDLVRALLILVAALADRGIIAVKASASTEDLGAMRKLIHSRTASSATDEDAVADPVMEDAARADKLWMLFVQHGTAPEVGAWLNGYRIPLTRGGGTLLVVREAELLRLERGAPDLASFVGPRIYSASSMLFSVGPRLHSQLSPTLPDEILRVLQELPGPMPDPASLKEWVGSISPLT